MVTSECNPLVDMLLKLSSIASNFASAANNTKSVSISDKHEVNELLDIVFDVRRISEKVVKVVEERVDINIQIINSGLFEQIMADKVKQDAVAEALEVGTVINKGIVNP